LLKEGDEVSDVGKLRVYDAPCLIHIWFWGVTKMKLLHLKNSQ